jgi:hypothetical protein
MRRSTAQYILYMTKGNDKGTHSIYVHGKRVGGLEEAKKE